jgi:hypothetical protein
MADGSRQRRRAGIEARQARAAAKAADLAPILKELQADGNDVAEHRCAFNNRGGSIF